MGLVDEVVAEDELIQKAKNWVLSASPQRSYQTVGSERL